MKRFLTFALSLILCVNSVGVLTGRAYDLPAEGTSQAQTDTSIYVSSNGKADADGSKEKPFGDLNAALSKVSNAGNIVILDDIVVSGEAKFPEKDVYINGVSGDKRVKITFTQETDIRWTTNFRNIAVEFQKDVFLNGYRVVMDDSQILGNPNIYTGAKDTDVEFGLKGNLTIQNQTVLPSVINHIYIGGRGNHTVGSGSVELKNVASDAVIQGSGVMERSYVTLSGKTSISGIQNISKNIISEHADVHIKKDIRGATELYAYESTIILGENSLLDIDNIYGDFGVDFQNHVRQRTFIMSRHMVGNVLISDELTRQGYRINKVKSGSGVQVTLLNPMDGSMKTDFAPSIDHPRDIVIREGTTADLTLGVSAWDFEDGDLTEKIVYPKDDLTQLGQGSHKVEYQVTDQHGNVTKSYLTVYVIPNAFPIFRGVEDIEVKAKDADTFDVRTGITVQDNKDTNLEIHADSGIHKPEPGTEKTFTINYWVEDSDHHKSTASRKIHVSNYVPQIEGLSDVVINKGDTFDFMDGVTANDKEDGKISDITIEQQADVNRPGVQEVIYAVTDSDGNTVRATRNVQIKGSIDWVEILPGKPKPPVPPTPEPPVPPQPPEPPVPPVPPAPEPEPEPEPPVIYTLTFASNGGGEIAPVSAQSGTVVELSGYVPTRANYVFAGWFADPDLTRQVSSVTLTANTTVYAKWTEAVVDNPFVDVDASDYFYKPVLWAVGKGITAGVAPDRFGPGENCTRGQIVTFLWSAAGKPEPKTADNPFDDVSPSDYYYKAVLWAVENGITAGVSDRAFGPEESCTRAQAVTFLWSAKGKPQASGGAVFGDVSQSAYYYHAVQWAVANGITAGVGGNLFAPGDVCTRGQIVTFLYKAYN